MHHVGRIIMGFYPSTHRVIDAVREALKFPEIPSAALDPCAGKGEALAQLTSDTRAITYGVELDSSRAEQAKARLAHVLNESLFNTYCDPRSFSLLLLNPPYDSGEGSRLEYQFLKRTEELLQPGGVLIYIVPEKQLYDHHTRVFLQTRYDDVRAYRFPAGEYERFLQAFLIGKRREEPAWDRYDQSILVQSFEEFSEDLRAIGPWTVPPGRGPKVFTSTEVSAEEVEADLQSGLPAKWLKDRLEGRFARMIRPLMPLKKGHIVQLLLGGFLDSTVIELPVEGKSRRVAVKGFARKFTETIEDPAEKKTVIRERAQCGITLLDLNTGEIEELRF